MTVGVTGDAGAVGPIASVIIPAHNEEAVVERLLRALTSDGAEHFEIVVACNGCTDSTAEVARSAAPGAVVLELPQPSKRAALEAADRAATRFPRLYVDADVELSASSAAALARALNADNGVLAAAPVRVVPRTELSPPVRWYYDVWERLPQVEEGLFGRGVIALSKPGNERVRALPSVMGDDLVASEEFTDGERAIVEEATVVVHGPRNVRDLYRRRVRAVTGNAQADDVGLRRSAARTSPARILQLAAEQPSIIPRLPVFLAITVAARVGARRAIRRGDFETWLRDESSRTGPSAEPPVDSES